MPEFTDNWVKKADDHIENWRSWTEGMHVQRILEVGSYEGRSALIWADLHPEAKVYCVDPFGGTAHGNDYEARFDANVAGKTNIKKYKGKSHDILRGWIEYGPLEAFDIIYIDGDHHADAVRRDAELTWALLRPGGIMIFDDYELTGTEATTPGPGIDAFLQHLASQHKVIHKGWQLAVWRVP